jgi:rubredoxin
MTAYACTVCSYGYFPSKGDPKNEIPPGTPFEKLPENWCCPWCGAPKSKFIAEGEDRDWKEPE